MARSPLVKPTTTPGGGSGIASDDLWKAEDDARTLHRAEEIKMDGKRHGLATKIGKKQLMAGQRAFGGRRR